MVWQPQSLLALPALLNTTASCSPSADTSICKRPYCGYKAAETMMRQKADGSGALSSRSRFQLHRVWLVSTGTGKYGRTPASDDDIKSNVVFSDRTIEVLITLLPLMEAHVHVQLCNLSVWPSKWHFHPDVSICMYPPHPSG